MSSESWAAIVTEKNSSLDAEYCDHVPQTEPLCRYFSEPDLAACWRHTNGTCKSKSITKVYHFAGMPQKLNDDEASSNGFVSQQVSKTRGWHLRDFEDEEVASFGNHPVPMRNWLGDFRPSEDGTLASFSCKYLVPMGNLSEDSSLPCKKETRPCKAQRMRHLKFMEKMLQLLRNDPDGFEVDETRMPPSIATDSARKARFFATFQSEKERILKDRKIGTTLAPLLVGQRQ